ncbi:MAG: SDR family NAD(P)-dependent oxidoreductase [Bdellovibrio sp.]|nr:SDR family NAD(P)-dependent oxidoreductase [Bdellovibrio sp.]
MILITGASSGIGEATAKAFAKLKQNLILIARRIDRLEKLSQDIRIKYQVQVIPFELDIRSKDAVLGIVKRNEELFSKTQVLVNNAGLAKGFERFPNCELSDWETMIDTNIKGLLYITKAVLPYMLKTNEGHIVNIGSIAGHWTYPHGNVYCATKSAVKALTESLRMDLSGYSIRVTEISPGRVNTEFSEVRFGNKEKGRTAYEGFTPLESTDIAEAITWCVSRPKHVNVQELIIFPTDQASVNLIHKKEKKRNS